MFKEYLDDADQEPGGTPVKRTSKPVIQGLFGPDPDEPSDGSNNEPFILSSSEPESFAETTRRSGLAWSAGIVFFASVVFMLIVGWGADLLLGTSPWGLVGGIILGSLIGFVQFFRLTSQIFK
ncbi:MAG: AtpZ/AtpI family protein [Pyrinomonadaceae bacterium]